MAVSNPLHALLDKKLLKECVHCGLCLDFCPTYRLLGHEADSPRGRIYQIRQVYEGKVSPDDEDFREHIYACLDCRACQTACPSGVQYGAIIEAARAVAEPVNASEKTIGRAILGTVFTRRPLLDAAGIGLRVYQRSGLQRLVRQTGRPARAARAFTRDGRHARAGSRRSSALGGAAGHTRARSGAVPRRLHRGLHHAAVVRRDQRGDRSRSRRQRVRGLQSAQARLLRRAADAHGRPWDAARDLARRNIDEFGPLDLDAIIINAAGCGSTLKEYGHLLADDPGYAERAHAFASKVKDVSEFLASIDLVPPTQPVPMRVTYQDACHLVHGQGIRQQPRKLLGQIPGLELVEMQDSDVCCGSAGIYNLTHPDLSVRVLDEKMDRVIATGAKTVVASNPGCTMQLVYGARRRGVDLDVVHVVDLLDRAYGG